MLFSKILSIFEQILAKFFEDIFDELAKKIWPKAAKKRRNLANMVTEIGSSIKVIKKNILYKSAILLLYLVN
jgi:hypothetical protein